MVFIIIKYCTHIAVFTGKLVEALDVDSETIDDLLKILDQKYPGFRQLFFTSEGKFNVRTMIYVKKPQGFTIPVINPQVTVKQFDQIIFI